MTEDGALIGYTGFVGRNLLNQKSYDYLYNSKNIEKIIDKKFDLIVCAGISSLKWKANIEPKRDFDSIKILMNNLENVRTKKFVLISTIDVYSNPNKVNEDTPIHKSKLSPYGRHRRIFEEFVEDHFNSTIIRLPGLFGKGLKKNVICDLINENRVEMIHPDSIYQFYNLENLWADIHKALHNNIRILNIATEPLPINEISKEFFGIILTKNSNTIGPAPSYNMNTKYGELWGQNIQYLYSKSVILQDLKSFVRKHKKYS
jgi:nucleoside-diphosphate-sugar epimerase